MISRQGRIYLLVADERKQLTAARQTPVADSVIFGSVKPSDIRKSLGPAHGECGRTRILIPDETGYSICHNIIANIKSRRLIIPDTVRFRILAAAGTGYRMPGLVIAFRLVRF
jgi:hypothetical protein